MRRRTWIGLLVATAGIAGIGAGVLLSSPAGLDKIDARRIIDNYELTAPDGSGIKLPQLNGQKILINFWGTWCPPCRRELPLLEATYVAGRHQIVALAVDELAPVAKFLDDNPLTMPVMIAGLTSGVRISGEFGNETQAMPYSVLLNEEGIIAASKIGEFANIEEIEEFFLAE